MNQDLYLNRVQSKFLQMISAMTGIHDACQGIASSPSQEGIDEIAKLATVFQTATEEFQASVMDFLQNVAEPSEEVKITASQTDIGYKIN